MINAAIKKWTQSGESRGNKCTAPNDGQCWRETNGKAASISLQWVEVEVVGGGGVGIGILEVERWVGGRRRTMLF